MSKSVYILLFPVSPHGLLTHHIYVAPIDMKNHSFAPRQPLIEPLIVHGYACAEADRHHLPSLAVPVKPDAAVLDIVVIVPFALQVASLGSEHLNEAVNYHLSDGNF